MTTQDIQQDEQIQKAVTRLQELLSSLPVSQGGSRREALGKYLEMPSGTVGQYIKRGGACLPGPDSIVKLRRKIPLMTDDDVKLLESAHARRQSLSRGQGHVARDEKGQKKRALSKSKVGSCKKPPEAQLTAESGNDEEIGRAVRQLVRSLFQPSTPDLSIGDFRWVLTEDNAKPIEASSWSKSDIEKFLGDTNTIVTELRRRLALVAQLVPDTSRTSLLKRLGTELDLLWRTFEVASATVPLEYLHDIDITQRLRSMK